MKKILCKILLCLILLPVIFSITGCSILDGGSLLEEVVVSVTPTPSPAPEAKGIGESWTAGNWVIKLDDIRLFDSIGQAPYDEKAASGKKLLVIFFDVSNLSETSAYFSNMFFKAFADGKAVMQKIVSEKLIEEREFAVGSIQPNKMKRYYVVYEVDSTWKEFEISYETGGMNSTKLAHFKFNNEVK